LKNSCQKEKKSSEQVNGKKVMISSEKLLIYRGFLKMDGLSRDFIKQEKEETEKVSEVYGFLKYFPILREEYVMFPYQIITLLYMVALIKL